MFRPGLPYRTRVMERPVVIRGRRRAAARLHRKGQKRIGTGEEGSQVLACRGGERNPRRSDREVGAEGGEGDRIPPRQQVRGDIGRAVDVANADLPPCVRTREQLSVRGAVEQKRAPRP